MPIHLSPISRRSFVAASLASLAAPRILVAQDATDDRWILIADSHIAADPKAKRGETCMADNFKNVASDFLKTAAKSAGVLLNGDAAFLKGLRDDYSTLASLLTPISAAGLPIHITLGNHDDRDVFLKAFADRLPTSKPLASHHVAVVEGKRANFFLLDSLEIVNGTPGLLGSEQLRWLADALDAKKDKPALVFLHHNPALIQLKVNNGLKDTEAFLEVIKPRSHVKAVVYGHTHHWAHEDVEGLHFVNLPPTAYVFQQGDPNGWVELTLADSGARFKLHALDPEHKANGQTFDLKWRT